MTHTKSCWNTKNHICDIVVVSGHITLVSPPLSPNRQCWSQSAIPYVFYKIDFSEKLAVMRGLSNIVFEEEREATDRSRKLCLVLQDIM